jgi:hypothetical protein
MNPTLDDVQNKKFKHQQPALQKVQPRKVRPTKRWQNSVRVFLLPQDSQATGDASPNKLLKHQQMRFENLMSGRMIRMGWVKGSR